ncbi:MAG TPA: glycosyl hydrolase, partial [Clostridia bacterium]|nr:glycosyl hydrolase [Clostridia bacterium]
CTGAHVSTSSAGWQGRVIDYMSEKHFRAYWGRHVEPLLREIGPLAGKTLTHLQTDSWELGGINWSDTFAKDFKRFRGYEVIPYLPIVAGKIIDNRDTGTRFLADFRKTIGDCVSEHHYGMFAKMARQYGMAIQPESAGPHAGPFDGLKNYGHSDIMMSEFWVPSPHRPGPTQRFFVKQASSAAHIFNRRLVGAESFTSIGPHWNDVFWSSQRPSFDHEMCSGLNLVLLHTFTCSPKEMGLPGQEYFAGTHFNPQVTWWSMSDGFISYLRRCQFLAQQGKFVGDALYYYGDHVPNIGRLKQDDPAGVLPGFDYDLINEDILVEKLSVKNGRLVLPHGMSYRVLVLPDHKVLSLAVLRKVRDLARAGATIIGPKPDRTVSLVSFPASERELQQVADELWGKASEASGERQAGKGRVIWGRTAREVLLADGVAPDFQTRGGGEAVFDYIHYTVEGADCYFVCNQDAKPQQVEALFRTREGRPELWDAVTGEVRPAPQFKRESGGTAVPLQFEPYGSVFVMFRRGEPARFQHNYPTRTPVQTIEGPWQVRFQPGRGAPETVTLEYLTSWTEHSDPGVRFFSGVGTYVKQFSFNQAGKANRRWALQLNDIRDVGMARVRVNGKDCGVAWAPPFQVDITAALKPGDNALEIEVANSWRNRLVGDRPLAKEQRITQTNVRIVPEWTLLPSGLIGPVQIVAVDQE